MGVGAGVVEIVLELVLDADDCVGVDKVEPEVALEEMFKDAEPDDAVMLANPLEVRAEATGTEEEVVFMNDALFEGEMGPEEVVELAALLPEVEEVVVGVVESVEDDVLVEGPYALDEEVEPGGIDEDMEPVPWMEPGVDDDEPALAGCTDAPP
jgi:hypothetical protein